MLGFLKKLMGGASKSVSPDSANQLMQKGLRMVDVREASEVAQLGVPGAVNIPLGEIQRLGVKALEQHGVLPSEDESLLVLCRSGARSGAACSALSGVLGERAINVQGGIMAWSASGLPTVRGR